ncbi:MAG: hypothetical protein KatS3mg105_3776 [Gemmatales bacterium]|nr:MAG: hypothetical protein KatS3mg105_3776 [Gemmatales bacterium]
MNRRLRRLWFLVFAGLFAAASVQAQTSQEAKVRYFDRQSNKEVSMKGVVAKESLAGIELKTSKGNLSIPSIDVVDVDYEMPSSTVSIVYHKARNAEREKKYDDAIKIYNQVLEQKSLKSPYLRRYISFRILLVHTARADADDGYLKTAMAEWDKFQKANPDCWELATIPKYLVPLQLRSGNLDAAQATLNKLMNTPNAPPALKAECKRLELQILVENKKYDEVENRLLAMIKPLAPNSLERTKLEIDLAKCRAENNKLAEAEKVLQEVIKKAPAEIKADALNTLGELLYKSGSNDPAKLRRAMWNHLSVDVIYNQDKTQQARALYNLYKVFKGLNDLEKASQVRDKLLNTDELAGRYQELMKKEAN